MAEDELVAFRERWRKELTSKKDEQPLASASSPSCDNHSQTTQRDLKNRYFEEKINFTKTCNPSKPEEGGCIENKACADGGGGKAAFESEDQPEYVSIARSLLDGRTSPLLDRIQEERTRRKRQYQSVTNVCSESLQQSQSQLKARKEEKLVDQLIQDLV